MERASRICNVKQNYRPTWQRHKSSSMLKLLLRLLVLDTPGETEESRGSAPPTGDRALLSSIKISPNPISTISAGLNTKASGSSSSAKLSVPRSRGLVTVPPTEEVEEGGDKNEEGVVWLRDRRVLERSLLGLWSRVKVCVWVSVESEIWDDEMPWRRACISSSCRSNRLKH